MGTGPTGFSIATGEREGLAVIVPRGELDIATAPDLQEAVDARMGAGQDVVVDLRELEFMDSSGLRVLVAAHTRARVDGTRFAITRPRPESAVAKILAISGLDAELEVVDEP
jgi:anti-anti-sigma factor